MAAPTIGRRPFTPKSAKVDYSHPLAAKLDTLVLLGADPALDLVTGKRAAVVSVSTPLANSPWGGGRLFQNAPTTSLYSWTLAAKPCPPAPFSALVLLGQKNENSTPHFCPCISYGGVSTGWGWCVSTGNITTNASAALIFGSVNTYSFAGLPADGSAVHLLFTVDAYGGTARCYMNGTQLATAAVGTADHAAATMGFTIGATHTGSVYTNGSGNAQTMAAVWTRCLTAADAAALFADPFCMLTR